MSVSDDIGNLFQRFGGDPNRYQEVSRDDEAQHAAARWPLLSALDIAHPGPVPGAGQPLPGTAAAQVKSTVQTVAGAPAANAPLAGAAARERATSDLPREPLFARGHRHATMPPPVEPARPASARFSAAREVGVAAGESENPAAPPNAAREEPVRAPVASVPQATTALPPVVPLAAAPAAIPTRLTRDESRPPQVGILTDRKQTFAQAPAPGAAPAQPQPVPRAAAGGSILSGMFAAPAPEPSAQPASRELASVFTRLAGTPGNDRTNKPGGGRS